MDGVYQEIWDADQSQNGLPALRPGEATDSAKGFVIVDERATAVDADHKVIKDVSIPISKRKTYDLCIKLFDNYALLRATGEFVRPEEIQEELNFIDAILPTAPIQKARQIMEGRLNLSISNDLLASMIRETWFQLGKSGRQQDASGFEHVFVGEQAKDRSKIGGYHYWHKYFLDDGGQGLDDRLKYHGTKYHKAEEPDKGILVPEVVTLSLSVELAHGNDTASGPIDDRLKKLSKPIGFFLSVAVLNVYSQWVLFVAARQVENWQRSMARNMNWICTALTNPTRSRSELSFQDSASQT